jgi:hypothetical protein
VSSWGGLLDNVDTWSCRFIAAVFVSSALVPGRHGTMDLIWELLAWSFAAIFAGQHPRADFRGRPFPVGSRQALAAGSALSPGGFFGVVHALTGDMEYFAKRLELSNFYPAAASPCSLCTCDRDAVPFKDIRLNGAWSRVVLRPPQPRPSAAAVFGIPGVTLFSVRLDLLHILDLGVLQHFLGSVLFGLIFDREVPGRTLALRLATVWARIRCLYASTSCPTRLGRLQISMFCDPSRPHAEYPVLKVKGSEARHLLPIVATLCEEYGDGTARDNARLAAANGFKHFSEVIARAGCFLTLEEATSAREALGTALFQYMRLAAAAAQQGRLLWNITNKFHFLCHVADQLLFLNPNKVWCYQLENLIGRAKRVAEAAKAGTAPLKLPAAFMKRYARVLQIALR